eukprot:9919144-Karenia_brevis.AAC.1
MPAAAALASGGSQQEDLQCLVTWVHKFCSTHNISLWVEWVSSADNWADGPSRGKLPPGCMELEIPEALNSSLHYTSAWNWFEQLG